MARKQRPCNLKWPTVGSEADPQLNAIGMKGLGEVVMTGVAAAVVNAVWHATGRRQRDLPIRLEHPL